MTANADHPYIAPLTELVVMAFGPPLVIAEEFAEIQGIEGLWLYGSWATRHAGISGRPPGDVDVLVVGDVGRDAIYEAARRAERRLGREVNTTIRTARAWKRADDASPPPSRTRRWWPSRVPGPRRVQRSRRAGGKAKTPSTRSSSAVTFNVWLQTARPARRSSPRASGNAQSAATLTDSDPEAAFSLAYDAARKAATALLAHQGLRPTTAGGHIAIVEAITAQFPGVAGLKSLDRLRRRRNQAEYPDPAGYDAITPKEATEALDAARATISAARRLLDAPQLGVF